MKVIAVRDSYFTNRESREITNDLAIHKGSIYHVVNKIFDPGKFYFIDSGSHYPNGVHFYELLEQTGFHVEDMFLELPEDLFETEKTKQDEYIHN